MGKLELAKGLLLATALISGGISAAPAAEEEYYTWIDENGITNYAERNPQGYEARFITSSDQRFGYQQPRDQTPDASAEAPTVETAAEGDAPVTADLNRDVDNEIAAERERIDNEIAAAEKSNCNIGKLNLAQLSNYNRIKVKDDDGSVRVLTDKEKQDRINRAKATIKENCKS